MSSTDTLLDSGSASDDRERTGPEVLGLDAAGTAAFLTDAKAREDAAAADQLRALTHWADLHVAPVFVGTGPELGREGALALGGAGVAAVAEFAVAEVAALLGMSERSTRSLLGQALELRDRLPRHWARVMRGDLPAWRARRIAERTIPLSAEAAGFIDAQIAPFAHKVNLGRIDAAVSAALMRFDPEGAADLANRAAEQRGVAVEHHLAGISTTTAITDTHDAVALEAALNTVAGALGALGDPDTHEVRRAKALGILADPQRALDLSATQPSPSEPAEDLATARPGSAAGARNVPVLHLHLHQDAIECRLGVARVAGAGAPGPVPLQAVQRWLAEHAPGAIIKLTPVVDLNQRISVDAYEHPRSLAQQVEHRDTCCVFPWCGNRGRFDLDHVDSYVSMADGGPPGQTNTANTARLCRFHHRLKTHSLWSYRRRDETAVVWISPLGRMYLVDHTGTRRLT